MVIENIDDYDANTGLNIAVFVLYCREDLTGLSTFELLEAENYLRN